MKQHITTALSLGMLLWFIATPASADESPKHKLKPNAKALMFNISSVFASEPEAFNNIGVGGRYVISKNFALRAGLGFEVIERETTTSVGNLNTTDTSEADLFGVEIGAEYYLLQNGPAGLYAGGMFQASIASSNTDDDDNSADSEVSASTLTLAGVLGANYFILERLTLGAEYRIGVSVVNTETTSDEGLITTTDGGSRIGVGSFGFHLGFWFD